MEKKRILISGYYGFDNFGDDAILQVLLSAIKENINNSSITVISKNPVKTKQIYAVDSIYTFDMSKIILRMSNTDLFISGGGSLLQDATSFKSLIYYLFLIFLAHFFRVKTYIYAQGIGPIKNKLGRILAGLILKHADLITVRDQKSKDFLSGLGVNSTITADPVWGIEKSSQKLPDDNKIKIGIQLREWHSLDSTRLNEIADSILTNLNSNKYKIILISLQDSQDLPILKSLESSIRSKSPDMSTELLSDLSVKDSISLISNLDYLIAMRYHACLISIKFNIPTLAISYDPKVDALSSESGILCVQMNNMDKAELSNKINKLITEKLSCNDKLKDFVARETLKSRQNVDLLVKILIGGKIEES